MTDLERGFQELIRTGPGIRDRRFDPSPSDGQDAYEVSGAAVRILWGPGGEIPVDHSTVFKVNTDAMDAKHGVILLIMSTRSAILTANGELAYDVRGSGPGLLLLHPTGYDRRVWDRAAELLAGRFRCVSPDERGWGRSEGQPGQSDRLADVRAILDDAAVTLQLVAAVGGAVDIAIGLALDVPDVAGIVLINPGPQELLAERDPHYLGNVIEEAREAGLSEMGAQIEGAASAAEVNERVHDLVMDSVGAREDPDVGRLLDEILATMAIRAQDPQPTHPIAIMDQLDRLTARVLLVEVIERGSMPYGTENLARNASAAICDALSSRLRAVHRKEVSSSWSDLLPLGNPSLTATIISDFADKIGL